MRIVYMGSGHFGLPTLEQLAGRHEVAMVVSQPDRPAGRHRRLSPTPVAQWAEQAGLTVLKTDDCNQEQVIGAVRQVRPDVVVVIAFGQYIGSALRRSARLGAVNLHASLLPKYRGAGPIHWAILKGEKQTGNTVIRVARKMDAGAILGQQATAIEPRETAGELHDRLAAMGPGLMLEVLEKLAKGTIEERPQDERQASLAPKLSRADGWVDFAATAQQVRCRIHGLTPWPGVRVQWESAGRLTGSQLLLRRVEAVEAPPDRQTDRGPAAPGTLLGDAMVACGQGAVRLVEVQKPGQRVMTWADYVHGHPVPPWSVLRGFKPGGPVKP